jgi:DNA-binding transcriptional LysR family regulator
MMRPRQGLLVARRVGQIVLGLHAHQNYLSRHGTPKTIADLANHALIGFDEMTAFIRDAGKKFSVWRREAFSMRTDNSLAQLALIRSGAGIGVCQAAIARRDGQLVRILPKQFAMPLETWITMHKDLRNSPRCRVTFDALVEGLDQYVNSVRA